MPSLPPRHLVVMVKEPRPGKVKTRLGRDIGMTNAAWWFRHRTSEMLRRLESPKWHLWLAVSPDHEGLNSRVWPARFSKIPQGRGDLGQRMSRAFRRLPRGPACIIGGDIPGIQPKHIETAFRALGHSQTVFGPARDGGYWLIGLKRTSPQQPSFLTDVRWSTEHALADSIASVASQSIALIDTLSDVDTLEDLKTISL